MSQEKGKGHLTGLFAKHMVFVKRNCALEQFTKKRIEREFISSLASCLLLVKVYSPGH